MHWVPIALGSILAFTGRAWVAWHVPNMVPRWWVMTGELALAGVPALLGIYGPGWAGMLWLLTGFLCFTVGFVVDRRTRGTHKDARRWRSLTASATMGSSQTDLAVDVIHRRMGRLAAEDPEAAEVLERAGLRRV